MKRVIPISLCLALAFTTMTAYGAGTITVGEAADIFLSKTGMMTGFAHFLCGIIGTALLIMAAFNYKGHLDNPKFIPLERPIVYLFLGFFLVCFPWLGSYFLPQQNTIDLQNRDKVSKVLQVEDPDAPLEWGEDYEH